MASAVVDLVTFSTETVVKYEVTEAQIEALRETCSALSADTPKGYKEVRQAIGNLRDTRVAIEKRRVELKADALAYGRKVDSEAKRFTDLLASIEDPLKSKKQAVDDEKARVKAEAEAAKLAALEAEIVANRERQEAEARAKREAEEAKLAEERAALERERQQMAEERRRADEAARIQREADEAAARAERDRLTEERRQYEEAQRAERDRVAAERAAEEAKFRAEREALEADRRAVQAERERAERAEAERLENVKREEERIAQAESDRLAEEERLARIEALRPDLEKLGKLADRIRMVASPSLKSDDAKAIAKSALAQLEGVAQLLDAAIQRAA
jgi:DNA repair exonuclease SbcCD ATPase subunit